MGIFEKLGLVSSDEVIVEPPGGNLSTEVPSEQGVSSVQSVLINPNDISSDEKSSIINNLYNDLGGFNPDTSIYRIKEFIDTLPAEMPTNTKVISIRGILAVSRIDSNDLLVDGQDRIEKLIGVSDRLVHENDLVSQQMQEKIADLNRQIDEAKTEIEKSQQSTSIMCTVIEEELAKLKNLYNFTLEVNGSTGGN